MLGPSGSGKTTLLRAILGLEPLSAGHDLGRSASRCARPGNRRDRLHPAVAPASARHRAARPRPRRARRRRAPVRSAASRGAATRARVDRAHRRRRRADFADRPVGVLSGGEQQRLRVGQALADDPALLLCDEPLTSLDLANQQAVVGLIDRHRTRARRRRAAGDARHQPGAEQGRPHPLHRERPVHPRHPERGAALATC